MDHCAEWCSVCEEFVWVPLSEWCSVCEEFVWVPLSQVGGRSHNNTLHTILIKTRRKFKWGARC